MWTSRVKQFLTWLFLSNLLLGSALSALPALATPVLHNSTAAELKNLQWETAPAENLSAETINKRIAGTSRGIAPKLPNSWHRFIRSNSQLLQDLYLPLAATGNTTTLAPQPMLATRWVDLTEEHKIVFELHPKATWSDGIPITTKDIVQTLFHLSDPTHYHYFQQRQIASYITGITHYDSVHFAIHYPEHFNHAPEFIFQLRPIAAHTISAKDEPPAVSGAYVPQELSSNQLILERQSPWWGDTLPALKKRFLLRRIILNRFTGDSIENFEQGQIDCIDTSAQMPEPGEWMRRLYTKEQITLAVSEQKPHQSVYLIMPARVHPDDQKNIQSYIRGQMRGLLSGTAAERKQGTDSKLTPDLKPGLNVFYTSGPTTEWLMGSMVRQVAHDELYSRLRTGFFEGIVATLPSEDADEIVTKVSLSNEALNIVPLYDIPYHLYACWAWVALPDPAVNSDASLSPLDPVNGGYIGIDRRKRTRVLNHPDRAQNDQPVILYYTDKK